MRIRVAVRCSLFAIGNSQLAYKVGALAALAVEVACLVYNSPIFNHLNIAERTMTDHSWVKEFPGNISVCDPEGILLEMNERALAQQEYGQDLIGANILDCHPEPARAKLKQMLESGQANIYTIEKRGKKKLIYQAPWYVEGKYAGFVELALEIPEIMHHFIRQG